MKQIQIQVAHGENFTPASLMNLIKAMPKTKRSFRKHIRTKTLSEWSPTENSPQTAFRNTKKGAQASK